MAKAKDAADLKPFNASEFSVGVAVGLFNGHVTGPMKELVVKTLTEDYSIPRDQITVVEVAGAADMPAILEAFARKDEIDCIVAIGAIIRGATAHFDYVAQIVTEGVKDVQIKHAKPIAFAVLTVDTEEQATERIEHAERYAAAAVHAARNIRTISI